MAGVARRAASGYSEMKKKKQKNKMASKGKGSGRPEFKHTTLGLRRVKSTPKFFNRAREKEEMGWRYYLRHAQQGSHGESLAGVDTGGGKGKSSKYGMVLTPKIAVQLATGGVEVEQVGGEERGR